MGEVNQPYDLMSRMKDLERQVNDIRKRVGLGNATISSGSLKVLHPNGTAIAQFGTFTVGGVAAYGWILRRPDGSIVTYTYGTDDLQGFSAWFDKGGNTIIADDGVSGVGLARPYVPGVFQSMTVPTDTNSTGTFTTLQKAIWRKQHPRVTTVVLTNCTSTTAQWRFVNAGTAAVLAGPFTINNGFGYSYQPAFDLPGNHMDLIEIDIQGRVASGAGAIGARVLYAEGVQS